MPKLSIVIPNYNGGKNLKRSIESCKTIQITEDNYEILIIDNKSLFRLKQGNLPKVEHNFKKDLHFITHCQPCDLM